MGWDLAIFRFSGFRAETITAAMVGRARWRLGHGTSPDWHNRWNFILNMPVVMRRGDHEVNRYLQLAEAIGLKINNREPSIKVSPTANLSLQKKIPNLLNKNKHNIILLLPGSSPCQDWKRWPKDLWVKLLQSLVKYGFNCIFTGSELESELIDEIIGKAKTTSSTLNMAGSLSLGESAALAALSRTVVSADSGMMHIAAAVGTQVVGIFGPTDDKRTGPIGLNHKILRSPSCKGGCYSLQYPRGHEACNVQHCMRGVSVDSVLNAILQT